MPCNFFVTGMPKSGKTTILRKVVDELKGRGLKVGGFISPEETEHGTRTGFFVEDLETGKVATLASTDANGPKVSKYHVDIKSFESIAVPSMENVDMYDVFVIDEIGRMELKSQKFVALLDKVFESPVPVIASLNRDYVDQYTVHGDVVLLTQTNREAIFLDLINKVVAEYAGKSRRAAKPKQKAKKQKARKKPKAMGKTKPAKKPKKKKSGMPKPKKEERHAHKEEEPKPKKRHGVIGKAREFIGF